MWQAKADTGCNGRAGTDLVAPGATDERDWRYS